MIEDRCTQRLVKDGYGYQKERHAYHEWELISEQKETQEVNGRLHYSGKYIRRWYCKWCRKVEEEKS